MTESHSAVSTPAPTSEPETTGGTCPFHGEHTMPTDGTPLSPSPTLKQWRDEGPAVQFTASDGNVGTLVVQYELAREVLQDARFSQLPQRFAQSMPFELIELDERAQHSIEVGSPLGLDDPDHARVRRAATGRFSVKAARGYRETFRGFAEQQLREFVALGSPADLFADYAEPLTLRTHAHVLGVPDSHVERFGTLLRDAPVSTQMAEFIREIFAIKRETPADDIMSDLAASSDLSDVETEGLAFLLLTAGRDSMAYLVATAMVALLSHPEQFEALKADPSLMPSAIEEFLRFGGMFIGIFPRTPAEDVEIDGVLFPAGKTVWISPVSANRDERRFDDPDTFDITRDAFGHLGFGHGIHGCVGQQVARVVITEAVTCLMTNLPSLALVEAAQAHPLPFAGGLPTYSAGAVMVEWD